MSPPERADDSARRTSGAPETDIENPRLENVRQGNPEGNPAGRERGTTSTTARIEQPSRLRRARPLNYESEEPLPSEKTAEFRSALALVMRSSAADRHFRAALTYDRVAEHHDEAAGFWLAQDDPELAVLEQRSAALARQMATLERDCAEVADRRADAATPTPSAFP